MKRLLDPYGSLGLVLDRVNLVALFYSLEAVAIIWALVALQWTAVIVLLALVLCTAVWEGNLISKLKVNLSVPAKGGPVLWPRFLWAFVGVGQYYYLIWLTHISDRAHQSHDAVAASLLKRFANNWPWFEALILAIYFAILATVFVVKWRKTSKLIFERPPPDSALEQMARELDDWLTSPKKAIQ